VNVPTVGVAIATRDRRDELLRTLDRLSELPERVPVVVADNGSGDGSPSAVRAAHPRVRVLELGHNLGAAARTVAARRLPTDLVAFADDDSWWAPGALAEAAHVFGAHPRLGLICARILVGPEERLDSVCAEMSASPLPPDASLPGPPILGFVACGAIVRREAFLAMGGFHPRFGIGGEEEVLAADLAAAGWGLAYVERVVAHHHPAAGGVRPRRLERQIRNRLWAAWLRRPLPSALRLTAAELAPPRRSGVRALASAAGGLPWVLRERRPVPPGVEARFRRLERAGTAGPAAPES
jgi:GT2 family glycosyltransferase